MKIVRHVLPDGMPLLVDAVLTDGGDVDRDSIRIHPVFPSGKVGKVLFSPPIPSSIEDMDIADFFTQDNNDHEPDIQDNTEENS